MNDLIHQALDHLSAAEGSLLTDVDHYHLTSDNAPCVWNAISLVQDAMSELRGEIAEREQFPLVDLDRVVLTKREVLG